MIIGGVISKIRHEMDLPWWMYSLLLCVFGFLKEIRPSEPYIYDYLTGEWKNFTGTQVEHEVYPVRTYATMILLLFVLLVTDMLRYKPLLILLGLSGMATWAMLLWTNTLFELQVLEVFYAMFNANEVAYYAYIYAKVKKEYFQRVSSHTRAAYLFGRTLSGILSQALTSTDVMDYKQLNYISFTSLCVATVWSLFLPRVKTSIYFHTEDTHRLSFAHKNKRAFSVMKQHFLAAFKNPFVLKWCLWWSLSCAGYAQVENYMQPLYSKIQGDDEVAYNGAVEAILTFLGFVGALTAGLIKLDWKNKGEIVLGTISIVQGVLMIVASQTTNIFVCYTVYTIFGFLLQFMITIANAQIASNIEEDSYGLIFGINYFIMMIFDSILTFAVATKGVGFQLQAREMYVAYGGYHIVIAIVFLVTGARTYVLYRRQLKEDKETEKLPEIENGEIDNPALDIKE